MKRIWLPALCFSLWMAFLGTDIPVKESFLPAPGRFMSPFQGIWQSVDADERSYHFKGQTKSEVKILFDERDVPHIYAESLEDALYAQGYLHAAHRYFSMDLSTRAAAGRLSELIGSRTLAIDRKQRERGFEWSAQQKVNDWEKDPNGKAILEAYVKGVNDYLATLRYKEWPIEYKILSHDPVHWTTTHSALSLTNMAITLCLAEDDLEYSLAQTKLSPEDYAFLFPDHNPKESPIIPSEKKWTFEALRYEDIQERKVESQNSNRTEDARKNDLNGSNNWAISARKTAGGFPILANDPHLGLTLPNIWYEMQIHTPEMSVHGVSLPGLPFIIIGFNEFIAWGTTNSGQDVLDWYQITWEDSTRLKYRLDAQFFRATLRPEKIIIRGAKALTDTIRYTHWGPVTHTDEHKDMAMKWIGHQSFKTNDADYLRKINKAKNISDYRDAVASFLIPAQNKIFASVEGDIAISVAGMMPLRVDGFGETITSGESTSLDWKGYIPFDQAPFIINPERGFVSSANQAPADTSYPYPLLGKRIFEDYRGRMVNTLLASGKALTPEDMKAMQQNNYNLHAAELLPLLLTALDSSHCISGDALFIARQLAQWNYESHRDSLSPVYFDLWYEAFERLTWDELDTLGVMRPEEWRLVEIVRDYPDHPYFDLKVTTDKRESLKDIACASFAEMVEAFDKLPAQQQTNWGGYKDAVIPHLARLPHFGKENLHTSGGRHIINAMSKTHGPSWKMIVELSNPPKAWVNYPGGQSGNPASPHYTDMLDHFFEGKYYEVALRKDSNAWPASRQINISPL